MTYIRDLIEIPERVHQGDFVLRLTEGVTKPEETLRDYVVTPQLVRCFDNALGFIKSALDSRSSKGAYLHGSFGSGKSHFMAVLHLLLQHNAHARSLPDLASVVARHNDWSQAKKFLLVPYHMIGARNMETSVLGHYVEHVRKLHPEAPIPGVYLAEKIFEDAMRLRQTMGDEAFFAELGSNGGGGGGWGDIEAGWDSESFEAALEAAPGAENRTRLVGDLVEHFFSAYHGVATGHDEAFVSLDEGLSIISRHAQGLGYDAIILFLDELILWLASHASDLSFVNREGSKLSKFVEATTSDRPIPIVSFVARQRDLRELVGDHITGAQQLGFADVLNYWEARFHTITLEDRNLPAIAEKRVLRPKSETARQELDRSFHETEKVREEVMNTLLTSTADKAMFRQVYPFSPALMQTLIAVSSVLQRERTALKVMVHLLVRQRDRLKLGDIVPVGDLYDVIAEGDEPFTEAMKIHFENAKKLYRLKLRPMLEKDNDIRVEDLQTLSADDPKAVKFRADDRLVKTLLLSALVPEVEALKALTPARLAALNHGTVRSPIAGREGQMVLGRCRHWAAQVGEIKIGEESTNPTISIQLSGVDTESIIENARSEDNQGNRRRLIRETLFAQIGITEADELFISHEITWRGTRRTCAVVFGNVRDLNDESLRAREDEWKVVIDFPFDDPGHTPRDDIARLQEFRSENGTTRTLVWLPQFFSRDTQRDLGKLVILEHVLKGERFDSYASHLSAVDRAQARSLLENQRSQLRQRIINCLEGAYGVAAPPRGSLDTTTPLDLADHTQSLDPTFLPQPPVGANLGEAFAHFLGQALEHQYPAHPRFEAEIKEGILKKVYAEVKRATEVEDGRVVVDRPLRSLVRQIVNPLQLGEMAETHFVLGQHWKNHFLRKAAEDGGPITVAKLRDWMEDPRPMGLPKLAQNLVILVFADQTNRSFSQYGGPCAPTLGNLPDDCELREQRLPLKADWATAQERAGAIFGVAASPLLNAANLAQFADDVTKETAAARAPCARLCSVLRERSLALGISAEASPRQRTATASLALVETLASEDEPVALIQALLGATVETSEAAMGSSIKKAGAVLAVLETTKWEMLEAIASLTDERSTEAAATRERVTDALGKDEYAVALAPVLNRAESEAIKLLTKTVPPPPVTPPTLPPEPPKPPKGTRVVETKSLDAMTPGQAREVLRELEQKLEGHPERRLTIEWRLYEPGEEV